MPRAYRRGERGSKGGVMAISGALVVARQRGLSAVRANVEGALARLRIGSWPVVQTAVAATLAWSAAALVLGHEQPFVAAIAAVISVGAAAGQTLKRAAEWILGVAVGLTVADLIMLAIGTGPIQTGIIVGLAMFAALLIRSGIMFVTEAGVSAVLVAGLDPTTYGVSPDRFLEALVGGGAALAVSAAFPSNPSMRARQAVRPVLEDLATALRDAAAALIGGAREGGRARAAPRGDPGARPRGGVPRRVPGAAGAPPRRCPALRARGRGGGDVRAREEQRPGDQRARRTDPLDGGGFATGCRHGFLRSPASAPRSVTPQRGGAIRRGVIRRWARLMPPSPPRVPSGSFTLST